MLTTLLGFVCLRYSLESKFTQPGNLPKYRSCCVQVDGTSPVLWYPRLKSLERRNLISRVLKVEKSAVKWLFWLLFVTYWTTDGGDPFWHWSIWEGLDQNNPSPPHPKHWLLRIRLICGDIFRPHHGECHFSWKRCFQGSILCQATSPLPVFSALFFSRAGINTFI